MTEIIPPELQTSKTLEVSEKLTPHMKIQINAMLRKADEAYAQAHKEGNQAQAFWHDGYVIALKHVMDIYG